MWWRRREYDGEAMTLVLGALLVCRAALASSPDLPQQLVLPQAEGRELGTDVDVKSLQHDQVDKRDAPLVKMAKHFYLWTRSNAGDKEWQDLDESRLESITNSSFASRNTYLIIHGFLGWGIESWILQMKDKLLNATDSNVISVDWPAGTEWFLPSYYNAVGRVPIVGRDTARIIALLVKLKGLSLPDVHMIGHSLGAHVSGLAAKRLKFKVGRISGLDPAGLTYHDVPANQRLDASDAEYVDIIHTNGCRTFWKPWTDCYGIDENLGHSDFWPNGGEHQPGCKTNGDIGCDHELAYKYFLESISYGLDDTYFLARNCSAWSLYEEGDCPCGDEAQYMGFFANPSVSGVFYLNTSTSAPYAEKDSVCSPGSKTEDTSNIALIASCSSVSVIAIIAAAAVAVVRRRRQDPEDKCGLIVDEAIDDALITA